MVLSNSWIAFAATKVILYDLDGFLLPADRF